VRAPGRLHGWALVLLLSACAVAPPAPTLERSVERPFRQAVELMVRQADACWSRKPSWTQDGILVDVEMRKSAVSTLLLSVSKYGPDIGVRPAFFRLEIEAAAPERTLVRAAEGEYAPGARGNYSGDVERWLAGDLTCRTQ